MRRLVIMFTAVAGVLVADWQATAQQKRVSPHETISTVAAGNRVTITYGRPYSKDPKSGEIRKIWGGLVPWGKAWRTGSDEATTLITQQPIMIGDAMVPAGAYTLYTVPMESGASKLAISKNIGGWGIPVDERNDLARVDMKKDEVKDQVDQFTMALDKAQGGGIIKMTWEKTQFSVPFSAKK
jgi:Protein of unknown function (DUF2911)